VLEILLRMQNLLGGDRRMQKDLAEAVCGSRTSTACWKLIPLVYGKTRVSFR
jgi:hypothetical protein